MSETIIFQRRNRLKNHFVNTSNVLLWCYQTLSDAARRLYQILDGFDYLDPGLGTSKGYVYPKVETLARIIGKDARSVHRYLKELIGVKLITRVRRRNQASVFVIEDISQEQIDLYIKMRKQLFSNQGGGSRAGDSSKMSRQQKFASISTESAAQSRNDRFVDSCEAPETTDLSVVYIEEKEEKKKNVNVHVQNADLKSPDAVSVSSLLDHYHLPEPTTTPLDPTAEEVGKRDYIAYTLASALDDPQGLGCYRRIAETIPDTIIFQTLGLVKESADANEIRTSKAALFVAHIKRYASEHKLDLGFKPTTKQAQPSTLNFKHNHEPPSKQPLNAKPQSKQDNSPELNTNRDPLTPTAEPSAVHSKHISLPILQGTYTTKRLDLLWSEILNSLKPNLSSGQFSLLLNSRLLNHADHQVTIALNSAFNLGKITQSPKLQTAIQAALSNRLNEADLTVTFITHSAISANGEHPNHSSSIFDDSRPSRNQVIHSSPHLGSNLGLANIPNLAPDPGTNPA